MKNDSKKCYHGGEGANVHFSTVHFALLDQKFPPVNLLPQYVWWLSNVLDNLYHL